VPLRRELDKLLLLWIRLFRTFTLLPRRGRFNFGTVYMNPSLAPHALYHISDITYSWIFQVSQRYDDDGDDDDDDDDPSSVLRFFTVICPIMFGLLFPLGALQ